MQKVTEEEEKEALTDKRKNGEEFVDTGSINESSKKKKKKNKKKKGKKNKKDTEDNKENEKETAQESKKKTSINSDQFIINDTYNLIKMLGFGTFGEIHLAYDTINKQLRAIKFEISSGKNPQLKHEHSILTQLNAYDSDKAGPPEGIPKVYGFNKIENKCNYMIMDFLGPSLADLFQFKNKQFSMRTVCLLAIQMLTRLEYIHEKGFIHRDIKPENFVIGLNEKSNIVHIIDFGLSKRYKDKNTGQHIPYRENRHLVGTARYASLNAHLGIEQSRRDDIESIGYVLVYFYKGRLPWQSKQEKGKQPAKIMEKKLITPPEILCKGMPADFAYYFHYCKNLKYEDRPDYSSLKLLFYELLIEDKSKIHADFCFDWYEDETKNYDDKELNSLFNAKTESNHSNKKKINLESDNHLNNYDNTPGNNDNKVDLIDFKDINKNFIPKQYSFVANNKNENEIPSKSNISFDPNTFLSHLNSEKKNEAKKEEDDQWSVRSSDQDTVQDNNYQNEDLEIKNILNAASIKNDNSDSQYKLLTSSDKSSFESHKHIKDDEIILKPKTDEKNNKPRVGTNGDIILTIDKIK